ncbi:MAG: SDR family oxidoreductase [Desulfobacteraceae bacterium]|jgi:3-oxoacyl-[acyl-carrier protein] reductase
MMDNRKTVSALILGGSCRLALNLVPQLLDRRIRPLLTYRNSKGKERILSSLKPYTSAIELIHLDFEDTKTLSQLAPYLKTGLNCLVDFAHSDYECLVGNAKDDEISAYFATNITFRAMVLKRVARAMLAQRKGRMVLISSTAVKTSNPGQGFYAAAKLAAEALYRNTGLEMSSKGITSAILRPGFIASGRGRRYLKKMPQHYQSLKKSGQIISDGDVTEALLYLLFSTGTSINGTVLTLDGGMTVSKH